MTITAPTPITTLPTPVPQTSDPTNFDVRADALLTALPPAVDQINAVAAVTYVNALAASTASSDAEAAAAVAAAATQLLAFSTDNLAVAAGTLTIHFTSPKTGFAVNDQVVVVLRSDTSIRMFGTVATFDGVDHMTVTVISSGVFGAGTFASWLILPTAFLTAGATALQLWAGASDAVAATPKSFADGSAPQTLAYAATITPDLLAGRVFSPVTLTGNLTLANPSAGSMAAAQGQFIYLPMSQDGTGSRTWAVGSYYKFPGGTPALSTAASALDLMTGLVISPTMILCFLAKAFA